MPQCVCSGMKKRLSKDFMAHVRKDSGSEMKRFANIAQNLDKLLEQHVPQSESVLYLVLAFLSLIRLITRQIVLGIWKMTLALMPTDQSWTWRLVSHFNL